MAIMTLKNVLDGGQGQGQLSSILGGAHADLQTRLSINKSLADTKKLEKDLNNLFYPKNPSDSNLNYVVDGIIELTEDNLIEIFNNFDFETNSGGAIKNKETVSPSTLATALETAAQNLNLINQTIANLPPNIDRFHLEDILHQSEMMVNRGWQIYNDTLRRLGPDTILSQQRIRKHEGAAEAIQIYGNLKALSKFFKSARFMTPQQAGIAFEKALAEADVLMTMGNQFIEEEVTKRLLGGKSIQRGKIGMVEYQMNSTWVKDNNFKAKGFSMTKNGMTISYNPVSAKQGKMDVQMKLDALGVNPQDYRISAKRWSKGKGSLGDTSIDAGLSRTSGNIGVVEAYKFAVLTPSWDDYNSEVPSYGAAAQAHEYAKLALKADIAMGISQGIQHNNGGAGMANLLIVDTGKSIVVRSIYDIINSTPLIGYNPGGVQNSAINIYRSLKKQMLYRTNTYLGAMTGILNSWKVSMYLNFR